MVIVFIENTNIVPQLRNGRVLNSAHSERLKSFSQLSELSVEHATRAPCFRVVVVEFNG